MLTTPTEFGAMLRERHGDALETRRGDWTDWWSDGAASSAYETGLNRTTHELVAAAEAIDAWTGGGDAGTRLDALTPTSRMSLYDEHTWGAFASRRAARLALHQGAVEPQVRLRLRRRHGDP